MTKNEKIENESFDFGMTSETEVNDEDHRMVVDTKNENEQDTLESDEESVKNEQIFSEDEVENSNVSSKEASNIVISCMIKFYQTITLIFSF